jgi:DNA-binding MarR family transcriptional regulator
MPSGGGGGGGDGAELSMELQQRVVAFVRAFGLHRPDETPCGAPVPVSEAHALTVLADGPLSQRDLSEALGLKKSTISRLVDQLEGRGWARRTTGDGDARQRLVDLTTEGRKTAEEIAARRSERMAQVLDRIPEADRPAVLAALDALVQASRGL